MRPLLLNYIVFAFLSYQRQAVAEGEDDAFDARVDGDVVVEEADAAGLWVAVVCGVDDVAVPKGVVGEDEAAGTEQGEDGLVGLDVCALVAVDEGHIEGYAQTRGFTVGVADDELNAVGDVGVFYPRAGEVFLFVVDFEGIDAAAGFEALGHADGTVAGECPDFKYVAGTYHADEHPEQTALKMAAGHAAVEQMDVGRTAEAVEVAALGVGVGKDVGGKVRTRNRTHPNPPEGRELDML